MVADLVRAGEEPAPAPKSVLREPGRGPVAPKGADTAMLDALVDPSRTQGSGADAAPKSAPPQVRKDSSGNQPDQGVIDSLLGDGDQGGGGKKK